MSVKINKNRGIAKQYFWREPQNSNQKQKSKGMIQIKKSDLDNFFSLLKNVLFVAMIFGWWYLIPIINDPNRDSTFFAFVIIFLLIVSLLEGIVVFYENKFKINRK